MSHNKDHKSSVVLQPYEIIGSFTALATAGEVDIKFENLEADFLIDDIRYDLRLNATIAGVGLIGAPLAQDASPSADNLIPFANRVRVQFTLDGLAWSTARIPINLLATSNARQPQYPPTPRLVKKQSVLNCNVQNNTGRTIDGDIVLVGRKARPRVG